MKITSKVDLSKATGRPWHTHNGTLRDDTGNPIYLRDDDILSFIVQAVNEYETLLADRAYMVKYRDAYTKQIAAFDAMRDALQRIANHETRADRRHRGMVGISEIQDLQRIAETAIKLAEGKAETSR